MSALYNQISSNGPIKGKPDMNNHNPLGGLEGNFEAILNETMQDNNYLEKQDKLCTILEKVESLQIPKEQKDTYMALINKLKNQLESLQLNMVSAKEQQMNQIKNMLFQKLIQSISMPQMGQQASDELSEDSFIDFTISALDEEGSSSGLGGLFSHLPAPAMQAAQTPPMMNPAQMMNQVSSSAYNTGANQSHVSMEVLATLEQECKADMDKVLELAKHFGIDLAPESS